MLKIQEFNNLTDNEAIAMYQSPALVAVLIAAADDNIETEELEWAKKIMGYRQHVGNEHLFPFYEIADTYFDETLTKIVNNGRGDQERLAFIESALESLNPIFAKVDKDFAAELFKSLKSFARSVAKSHGGFLGLKSINYQEAELIDLHMIKL